MTKKEAIAKYKLVNNNKWPKELWTGVAFYYGFKITKEEFNAT